MDLTGPFHEGPSGNHYILVVEDYFTKWMESYAVLDQEATTVAQKLVDEFFCRISVPSGLHLDKGKQFESKVISAHAICQLLQIDKSRTTPYHPQSDGIVERFNRMLTDILFRWGSYVTDLSYYYL